MTRDEAIILTKIMWTADSWCGTCARNLIAQLAVAFPEHAETIGGLTDETIKKRLSDAKEAWEDGGYVGDEPQVWTV